MFYFGLENFRKVASEFSASFDGEFIVCGFFGLVFPGCQAPPSPKNSRANLLFDADFLLMEETNERE